MLWQSHHVVARELPLLLQDLVLIDQEVSAEGLIFILLNKVLHLVMAEAEQFGIAYAAQVNIHLVLHEEGSLVDGRTLVQLLNHELVVFKLGVGLHDAVLDEVERVGACLFGEHHGVLLEGL